MNELTKVEGGDGEAFISILGLRIEGCNGARRLKLA